MEQYSLDRHSFGLRKLPIELHRKIYSYIYVDIMVHEWMYSCDLNDIIHTICDCDCNAVSVDSLYELYKTYDRTSAKFFVWRHTIPQKEKTFGYWYDDEHTDYYKMGNDFIKMISIEYGKLLESKNQEKLEKLYKVLSVIIYLYKNPSTPLLYTKNTVSS